jgi:DNA-3-methyladenine glycosylase II
MATPYYAKVRRYLSRRDAVLKAVIRDVGPCTWTPVFDDPLSLLIRCVISQQISTKAAETISSRLLAKLGEPPIRVEALAALDDEAFRSCGVSSPKVKTLRAVAAHIAADPSFLARLPQLPDDEFRLAVTQIKGIGPWSADMLLMFGISRPDILPTGDLGIKLAIRNLYGFGDRYPTVQEMTELANPWRPHRSVACWYLWRSLGEKSSAVG